MIDPTPREGYTHNWTALQMLRLVAVTGTVLAAAPAMADWTPVSGRVLKDLVAGSTVVIDAPMGFKLPIRHGEDGSLSGEAGGLSFYLGSSTDTGRWWVAGDRLCYKWERWFKSEPRCMAIRRDGLRIAWEKDDGETGTGTVTASRPAPAEIAAAAPRSAHPAAPSPLAATPPAAAPRAPAAAVAGPSAVRPSAPGAAATLLPKAAVPKRPPALAAVPAPAAAPTPRIAAQAPPPPYRVGAPPQPSYRVVMVADDDVLNVRQGPSAEHAAIAALGPDASGVRILGPCRSDWCFVRHNDIVGWVNSTYLAAVAESRRQSSPSAGR